MLKRWLLVISIPLIFQVAFLVILFVSQAYRTEAQKWALHTVEVIAQAESIGRSLSEARADVQSRILLRSSAKGLLDTKAQEVEGFFTTIHTTVEDNAKSQAVIDDVRKRARRYLVRLEEMDKLLRTGDFDAAMSRLKDPTPRQNQSDIRNRLQVFLEGENKLDSQRRKSLARLVDTQTSLLVGGAALSVALAIGMAILFSRAFASRMDILAQNAKSLAEGKALSAPLKGNDEIVQLDAVFRSMAKSLAERDQENEMFIYSVSHDLRSPLVNLQGFSKELSYTCDDVREILKPLEKPPEVDKRLKRMLDEDMPSSIHFIQNAVSRLSAIIDSLLRLSRAGRVEYRVEEVNVSATVGRVVEALEGSTKECAAEIVVKPLVPTWGDPTIIEQIFANLLSNAVKYLDPTRKGKIEVGVESTGPALIKYYVRDNGLGIAKNHQAQLFRAFQRLHPNAAAGEGIGLALVRRMVERHGGKIWAESDAGVGSTFYVTLPAHAPDSSVNGRLQPAIGTLGGGK